MRLARRDGQRRTWGSRMSALKGMMGTVRDSTCNSLRRRAELRGCSRLRNAGPLGVVASESANSASISSERLAARWCEVKRCSDSPDRLVSIVRRDTVNGLRGLGSDCGTSFSESVVRSESSGSDSTTGVWARPGAKGLVGGSVGEADEEGWDGRSGGCAEVGAEDTCGSGSDEGMEASGGEEVPLGGLPFALDCGTPLAANSRAPERLTLAWTLHGFKGNGCTGLSSGLSASLPAQHASHQQAPV
jgi:hypothetical protein